MGKMGADIILACMRLTGRRSLRSHYRWASFISWMMKNVIHYRRDTIITNISRAFPDAAYKYVRLAADRYYDHIARMIVEALWFGSSSLERLHKQRICEFTNLEVLSDIMKNGRSVMLLDTHCGNWELLGGVKSYNYGDIELPFNEDNFYVVYKALKNKTWDRVFYENRRYPMPGYEGQLEASGLLRFLINNRDKQSVYLINNDQYPSQAPCPVGKFLNQETTMLKAAPAMACKLGMAVVYMAMDNDRPGHYNLTFTPICENAAEMTPEEITARYASLLEAEIEANPANWLWSHKRWKNNKREI